MVCFLTRDDIARKIEFKKFFFNISSANTTWIQDVDLTYIRCSEAVLVLINLQVTAFTIHSFQRLLIFDASVQCLLTQENSVQLVCSHFLKKNM